MEWAPRDLDKLIADPREALDVFDFEPVMKKNVPPAHFGYMATGVDDEVTLRANREGFRKFELRPRRLVDVSKIDMSTEIFGAKYDSPIVIAPTGSNRAFHADGEIAVAKAAKAGNHLQMLSTVATTSIEDAIAARGAPVWFQLYTTQHWEIAEALVRRAEAAGAPVDRGDARCQGAGEMGDLCPAAAHRHARLRQLPWAAAAAICSRKPNFDRHRSQRRHRHGRHQPDLGFHQAPARHRQGQARAQGHSRRRGRQARRRRRASTRIVVSNHGGRAEDGVSSTIDALPEIVEAVERPHAGAGRQRLPPRHRHRQGAGDRAQARVHRPALSLGLGAFGQPGVERVLDILRAETRAAMQQLGAPSLKDLSRRWYGASRTSAPTSS